MASSTAGGRDLESVRLLHSLDRMAHSHPTDVLLERLTREFFQTETSAVLHCRREADRYPDSAYATPFREVANHAERILREFVPLARKEELPVSAGGTIVGTLFSQARDSFADKLISAERSYRGTMLGMRHGFDLVQLLAATARRRGRAELAQFFETWLRTRQPLLERCEAGFEWFAEHADRANERPKGVLGAVMPQRLA